MEIYSLTGSITDEGEVAQIALSLACGPCRGRGKVVNFDNDTVAKCEPCGGTGTRLTGNGWDLVRFLKDYATHPDAALEDPEPLWSL